MGSVEAYKTANVWKNFQNIVGVNQTTDQDYEYVPFVREGVKWVYRYYNNGYIPYDGLTVGKVYLNLEIKGDTIINGKTYKAMHKYYGDEINKLNDTIPVYLREENRVVYGIVPDGKVNPDCFVGYGPVLEGDYNSIFTLVWAGEEFVLYDFNNTQSYYEDFYSYWNVPYDPNFFSYIGCDTITIGNRFAKRHKLTENYHEDYIIEGIGFDGMNPGYTLAYFYMQMANFPRFHLSHVIEDGRIIYKGIHYIPGDVNGDGEVTIADANSVIDVVIMGGNAGHTRAPAADMDDNGEVNVTDLNIVIDLIIKGN